MSLKRVVRNISTCMIFCAIVTVANAAPKPADQTTTGKGADVKAAEINNQQWHFSKNGKQAVYVGAFDSKPELIFSKRSILVRQMRIEVESDAIECVLSSGDTNLSIPIRKDAVTEVILDGNVDSPAIRINGEEKARNQGRWTEIIAREKATTFKMDLTGATYATVRFDEPLHSEKADRPAEPKQGTLFSEPATDSDSPSNTAGRSGPSGTASPSTAPPERTSGPTQALAVGRDTGVHAEETFDQVLSRVKGSIFQLRVKNSDGEVFASGSGFLAASEGYGITNFHVVQGAAAAVAIFADDDQEHAVELWDVRPEADLAVVKISMAKKDTAKRSPLPLSTDPPTAGQEVWALGFPLDLGYSVNKGIVNGVRQPSQLVGSLRGLFPSGVKSVIQMDCTINPGNSGGPLIGSSGSVLGINTWFYRDGHNIFFALAASEARSMMSAAPLKPVTFAAAHQDHDAAHRPLRTADEIPWSAFAANIPRLNIDRSGTAEQLKSAAAALTGGLVRDCRGCGGHGRVVVRVTVGYAGSSNLKRPIEEDQVRQCAACRGTGKIAATPEAANKIAEKFCVAMATLKKDDPKSPEALDRAYKALNESLAGATSVQAQLNENALSKIAQGILRPGEPLTLTAHYLMGIVPVEETERVHYLRLEGSDQLLILRSPRVADEVLSGDVLVGGLIAGGLKVPDGTRVVVLQGGYMLKMKTPPTPRR